MPSSVRIARVDIRRYRLPTSDFTHRQALHRELTLIIRRHLPGVTASLLALPILSEDGVSVDWHSDLAGEARPLASLPAAQRKLVQDKLQDRLTSLKRLAIELPRRVRGSEELAAELRVATHYPGDEQLYLVGNEPVITFWGFVRSGGRGRLATPDAAIQRQRRRSRWLGLGGAALVLSAVVVAVGYWLTSAGDQALRVKIAEALAKGCADTDQLVLLARRAEQRDPDGQRFGDLYSRLQAEQAFCAEAQTVADATKAAGWNCDELASLADRLETLETDRAPLDQLVAEVAERREVCATAQRLGRELDQRLGDCAAVAALVASIEAEAFARTTAFSKTAESPKSPAPAPATADASPATEATGTGPADSELREWPEPLAQVRERITAELERCDQAARLEQALDQAMVDDDTRCDLLLRLDGQLGKLDLSRAPLQPVRERLDAELALCARAEAFSRDLIDAQMDCQRIKTLDQRMRGEEMRRPPLQIVRERLDEAVEACRALDASKQARIETAGDDPLLKRDRIACRRQHRQSIRRSITHQTIEHWDQRQRSWPPMVSNGRLKS
ncbi:hypothetical protein [Halochromatium sp.]